MSKFLKFIVHFVVICTILCVVALAVPPFFGVTTEIRDDSTVKSNLAMGSVTYAIPVKTEEAALGTPILVNDENAVYRYTLASADVANGTGTAMDPTVSQGQPINVAIGSYLPKIVVTIPFIGYLMAATKSIEGLIVLGLTVLFLIILYVIAELWKKDQDDYDDYPEDTEPGYVKSRKELKKEEKRKEREYRDEEREIKAQGKRSHRPPQRVTFQCHCMMQWHFLLHFVPIYAILPFAVLFCAAPLEQLRILGSPVRLEPRRAKPAGAGGPVRSKSNRWSIVMNQNSSVRKLARCGVVAAIYVVLCLALQPFSYGAVQVRVAEALCLLPVFGAEYILGVVLGCFLANLLGSTIVDVIFGTLATLLACVVTYKLRNVRFKGLAIVPSLPPVLFNAVIIGIEIAVMFPDPSSSAPLWLACITNGISVGIGELISCTVLGVLLVKIVETNTSLRKVFLEA